MVSSLIPDPLQMWRKALTTLESGGNSLANNAMGSGEFASALHQVANVSLGMQQTFEKVLGVYLKRLNLPSRKEITELSAVAHRIEAKLDQLITTEARVPAGPRPARTRRPAEHATAEPAPKAPMKRARKRS
jgi:hypothetical protein